MGITSAEFFYQLMAIYGVCRSGPCQRSAAMLTRNMDVNVDPCENFYGFACGNFPNRFPRMAHEKHLSQVTLRNDEIGDKVLEFYSKADLRPYPNIRKLYALYSQCMEEVTYGLDTVSHHLGMVGLPEIPPFHKEPPDSYEVIQVLAKVHRYSPSTHFLFDVDTKTDPHNVTANHITFGPTPSSINAHVKYDHQPTNKFELTTKKIREALVQNITKTVNFVYEKRGVQRTEEQNTKKNVSIQDVANFLIELAQIRNIDRFMSYHAWKYESFGSLQDTTNKNLQGGQIQINWYDYFETLFQGITNVGESVSRGDLNWSKVMIKNPAQLLKVLELLQRTTRHVFVCAIWFIVVQSITFFGPSALQNAKNEYDSIINDTTILPRNAWRKQECKSHLLQYSSQVVAYVLATQENGVENKEKITALINDLKQNLKEIINKSPWMNKNSKSEALLKLDNITTKVGYLQNFNFDRIDDFYQDTEILSNYYLTLLKLIQDTRHSNLSRILRKMQFEERKYTKLDPAETEASYYPSLSHIAVSSAIMGFPYYDLGLEALNYGALGVILAHELGHAFDPNGKMYAWDGKYKPLQQGPFKSEYEKREKCFEDSFGKCYNRSVDKWVDGRATLSENIADSIGFEVALRAYGNLVQKIGVEPFLEQLQFSHEQLFTLAFASMYCENSSLRFLSQQMETNDHIVRPIRVNGLMRHSKDFATIWNCKTNVPMNPSFKCTIFS